MRPRLPLRHAFQVERERRTRDAITVDDLRAAQPSPSTNLRAEERTTIVQEALSQLSDPKDREIIRLSFFEDLSLAQIGKHLQLSYDDVRSRFHGSLKRLGPKLKGLL